MRTGRGQGGASKRHGRTNFTGYNPIEGENSGENSSVPYKSAAARKAARRESAEQPRPGHVRTNREPNPSARTRPGRRKN